MEIMYVLMYIHDMLSTFMRFLDNSTVNSFFNSNSHTYSRLQVISLYVPCINKILRRNNYWKLTENSKLSHISILMILQIVQILKKVYKEQNKFMKIEIHMKIWMIKSLNMKIDEESLYKIGICEGQCLHTRLSFPKFWLCFLQK